MNGFFNSIKTLATGSAHNDGSASKIQDSKGESDYTQWHDAMKMVAKMPGGVPAEFRKKLWLTLAERHLERRGVDWQEAEKICFDVWTNPDDEELGIQIVKDLHRTGCSLFCGTAGRDNQAVLRRVLLGYARWNKSVGYCQGLNVLAALILQVVDRGDAAAIKVMIYLIEGVLPEGYFADNLRGLSIDMAVFRDLLHSRLPKLSKHLESLQSNSKDKIVGGTGSSYEPPLINVFTMQWFLTLFSHCLPQQVVLRVWDLIFLEGDEILLKTTLAIWEGLSDRVMQVKSADEFYSIMGVLTREMLEFGDTNNLIRKIVNMEPLRDVTSLREKHRFNITPWTHKLNDEESDAEEEERLAVAATMYQRLKKDHVPTAIGALQTMASSDDRDRLALNINTLKLQYTKLRERQRQAHIILSAACARQSLISTPTSQAMNHLFVGKNALPSTQHLTSDLRLSSSKGKIIREDQQPSPDLTIHWKQTKWGKSVEEKEKEIIDPSSSRSPKLRSDYADQDSDSSSTELCDETDRSLSSSDTNEDCKLGKDADETEPVGGYHSAPGSLGKSCDDVNNSPPSESHDSAEDERYDPFSLVDKNRVEGTQSPSDTNSLSESMIRTTKTVNSVIDADRNNCQDVEKIVSRDLGFDHCEYSTKTDDDVGPFRGDLNLIKNKSAECLIDCQDLVMEDRLSEEPGTLRVGVAAGGTTPNEDSYMIDFHFDDDAKDARFDPVLSMENRILGIGTLILPSENSESDPRSTFAVTSQRQSPSNYEILEAKERNSNELSTLLSRQCSFETPEGAKWPEKEPSGMNVDSETSVRESTSDLDAVTTRGNCFSEFGRRSIQAPQIPTIQGEALLSNSTTRNFNSNPFLVTRDGNDGEMDSTLRYNVESELKLDCPDVPSFILSAASNPFFEPQGEFASADASPRGAAASTTTPSLDNRYPISDIIAENACLLTKHCDMEKSATRVTIAKQEPNKNLTDSDYGRAYFRGDTSSLSPMSVDSLQNQSDLSDKMANSSSESNSPGKMKSSGSDLQSPVSVNSIKYSSKKDHEKSTISNCFGATAMSNSPFYPIVINSNRKTPSPSSKIHSLGYPSPWKSYKRTSNSFNSLKELRESSSPNASPATKRSSDVLADVQVLEAKSLELEFSDPEVFTSRTNGPVLGGIRNVEARRQDTFNDSARIAFKGVNVDENETGSRKSLLSGLTRRIDDGFFEDGRESKIGVWTKVKPRKKDNSRRRNSDRALKIIQENSAILHKILTCQAKKRLPDLEEISKKISISPINEEISKIFSPILERMGLNENEINEELARINFKNYESSLFEGGTREDKSSASSIEDESRVPDLDCRILSDPPTVIPNLNESPPFEKKLNNSAKDFESSPMFYREISKPRLPTTIHKSITEPIGFGCRATENPSTACTPSKYICENVAIDVSDIDIYRELDKLDKISSAHLTQLENDDFDSKGTSIYGNKISPMSCMSALSYPEISPGQNSSPFRDSYESCYEHISLEPEGTSCYAYANKPLDSPTAIRIPHSQFQTNRGDDDSSYLPSMCKTMCDSSAFLGRSATSYSNSNSFLSFPEESTKTDLDEDTVLSSASPNDSPGPSS